MRKGPTSGRKEWKNEHNKNRTLMLQVNAELMGFSPIQDSLNDSTSSSQPEVEWSRFLKSLNFELIGMTWHLTDSLKLSCGCCCCCRHYIELFDVLSYLCLWAISMKSCDHNAPMWKRNEELCESWWSKRLSVAHFNSRYTHEIKKKNEHTLQTIKTELNLNWMRIC